MRKLICLLVLAALAAPAQAKLKPCDTAEVDFEVDPMAPEWSREIPKGQCFGLTIKDPAGRTCSYGTVTEEVTPGPLDLRLLQPKAKGAALDSTSAGGYKLGKCEAFKVRVQCAADTGSSPIDKTYTVTTGQCGRWVTHYGVGFLEDENEEFFTSAVMDEMGMTTGFEIKAEGDRGEDYDTELVVTFTYLPRGTGILSLGRFGRLGFMGGVGADLDERLVMAGMSWIWGENVNLFVGCAGHMRTHLDGQFEVGQILKQDLPPDKLVDETYSVDLIFGASFRFDSNPFKKKSGNQGGGS